MRRLLARLGVAALLAGGGLAVSSPAQAAPCTGSSGVTVVVQSGGSADVRCASGDPGSAGAALQSAGFSVQQVQTQPGAICTIGGVPDTSCVRMPPTSRYWAFHTAPAGGSWSYSSQGAYAYDPKPGTVVGFRLGSGAAPSVAPPKVAEPKPTQKPRPTQRPRPTSSAPDRPSSSAPRGTSAPGGSSSSHPGSQRPGTSAPQTKGDSPASSSAAAPSSTQQSEKRSDRPKAASSSTAKRNEAKDEKDKTTMAEDDSSSSSSPRSPVTSPATDGEDRDDDATAAPEDTGADGDGAGSSMVPAAIGGGLLVVLGSSAFAVARMRRD